MQKIEKDKNECPECRTHIANRVVCRLVLDLIADIQLKNKQLEANAKFYKIHTMLNNLERLPPVNPVTFVEHHFAKIKNEISKHFDDTIQELKNKSKKCSQLWTI